MSAIFNLLGVTNPSTTKRFGYYGGSSTLPPASAGNMGVEAEFSTTNYSYSVYNDANVFIFENSETYPGVRLSFQINNVDPSQVTSVTVTARCRANNGYSGGGWTLYIKNRGTNSWESLGVYAADAMATLTGTKSSSISNYVNNQGQVEALAIGNNAIDGNGAGAHFELSFAEISVDYADGSYPQINSQII